MEPFAPEVPIEVDVVSEFVTAANPEMVSTYLPLQKQTPAAVELSFTIAPNIDFQYMFDWGF